MQPDFLSTQITMKNALKMVCWDNFNRKTTTQVELMSNMERVNVNMNKHSSYDILFKYLVFYSFDNLKYLKVKNIKIESFNELIKFMKLINKFLLKYIKLNDNNTNYNIKQKYSDHSNQVTLDTLQSNSVKSIFINNHNY